MEKVAGFPKHTVALLGLSQGGRKRVIRSGITEWFLFQNLTAWPGLHSSGGNEERTGSRKLSSPWVTQGHTISPWVTQGHTTSPWGRQGHTASSWDHSVGHHLRAQRLGRNSVLLHFSSSFQIFWLKPCCLLYKECARTQSCASVCTSTLSGPMITIVPLSSGTAANHLKIGEIFFPNTHLVLWLAFCSSPGAINEKSQDCQTPGHFGLCFTPELGALWITGVCHRSQPPLSMGDFFFFSCSQCNGLCVPAGPLIGKGWPLARGVGGSCCSIGDLLNLSVFARWKCWDIFFSLKLFGINISCSNSWRGELRSCEQHHFHMQTYSVS